MNGIWDLGGSPSAMTICTRVLWVWDPGAPNKVELVDNPSVLKNVFKMGCSRTEVLVPQKGLSEPSNLGGSI
ncbi:hypothetical protein ACLOJK_040323 [Asimina triloba]